MAPPGSAAATHRRCWLDLILGWGLAVCMAALVLAGLFRGMVFSSLFHAFEHHRLGTASRFAQAAPMTVVQELQTYFRSGRSELLQQPLFSYRERLHYREVKQLLQKAKTLCTWGVMGAVSLALGLLGYTRRFSGEGRRLIAIAIRQTGWILLVAVACCGLLALDFETQFVRLHRLLFESRHWLLPPYAASMQLFPTQYFLDFFRVYTVLTLTVAMLLWGLAHGLRRSDRLAYEEEDYDRHAIAVPGPKIMDVGDSGLALRGATGDRRMDDRSLWGRWFRQQYRRVDHERYHSGCH